MRIGLVTEWCESGAGYVSKAYEAALGRAGHDVFVFARGLRAPPSGPFWRSANVTVGSTHSALTGIHRRELRRFIEKHQVEALIFNEQRHWEGVIEARETGVLTGAYVDYYRADSVRLFELYDFLVCNTRRHLGVFEWHVQAYYVPWGADCELFQPRVRGERALTFFHSAGWGGFNDRKGTSVTLEAFARVRGDVRLVIHSQRALRQYPERCQAIMRNDKRIEFIEGTVDPPGLYHLGDVYVYPSRLDGIGLSVPEALASGLPVIAPNEPPWSEFVQFGCGHLLPVTRRVGRVDGYYWPEVEVSVDGVAEAMSEYARDPERAFAEGRAARETALTTLDWSKNGMELGKIVAAARRREVQEDLRLEARRHDLASNPTALQQWLRANWRMLRAVTTTCAQ